MEEIDKYHQMMKELNNRYSHYDEVDNRVEVEKLNVGDIMYCINNNFIKDDPSHGPKDGLTLNTIYTILDIDDADMIIIENDNNEKVPYFIWRFAKINAIYVDLN